MTQQIRSALIAYSHTFKSILIDQVIDETNLIVLKGKVKSYYEKQVAQEIALSYFDNVRNDLTVADSHF